MGDLGSLPLPPGPWALPFLGSLSVLWALFVLRRPLPDVLREVRAEHGPLFLIQTGPVSQLWVGDVEVLRRVYELPACCGRPAAFEDPFGNFLFLTREPGQAAAIKERQRSWLEANVNSTLASAAVEEAMPVLWRALDSGSLRGWPTDSVRTTMYGAVTTALLGKAGLMSDAELASFMGAVTEYTEMRTKSKLGNTKDGKPEPPPGSIEIKEILLRALARVGRDDAEVALPLLVAASVGGAEIFPNLLHWMFLFFSTHPTEQEEAARAAEARDSQELMRQIYAVLRRTPYSVALGPPRKILADAEFEGMRLPADALLFAMHPALVDEALGREPTPGDDFSTYAFGVGPRCCLGQRLVEALLPAAVGAMLRRYRVAVQDPARARWPMEGELRGQLMYPLDPPTLLWEARVV